MPSLLLDVLQPLIFGATVVVEVQEKQRSENSDLELAGVVFSGREDGILLHGRGGENGQVSAEIADRRSFVWLRRHAPGG